MKLLPILNKPAIRADNKQTGIVFLEYVIIAFIITVAVICAFWWFYYHLQQMTWETKQKLGNMTTNLAGPSGELNKPGELQPTPEPPTPFYYEEFAINPSGMYASFSDEIPFSNQNVVIHNMSETTMYDQIDFYDLGQDYPNYVYSQSVEIPPGEYANASYNHLNAEPYKVGFIIGGDPGSMFSVSVSQLP